MRRKSFLVIGGGAAGHQNQPRGVGNDTLTDPKTYWATPMAVSRLLFEPDALAARIPSDSFLGAAQHDARRPHLEIELLLFSFISSPRAMEPSL